MLTLDDAFELIHDAVRHALVDVQEAGAAAFRDQRYEAAQTALDRARDLAALADQVKALEQAVDRLLPARADDQPDGDEPVRPVRRRSRRGLKTPEAAYLRPILEVLIDLGGSGEVNDVLDRVYARVKDQLNDQDHSVLPSDSLTPRWRNTAQWARNTLREQGLVRGDTPRGVWTITDHGRAWLEQQP